MNPDRKPNVVFVFGDQWRAQATGYAGDPNVKTPNLDRLAAQSVNFTTAVANCPVCSPYRATLLTGQNPLTHGVFVNDVHLSHDAPSIADAFKSAGYDTAYVGKWHLNGRGRSNHIPAEDRQGFDFWRVLECTHKYNESHYYGDSTEDLTWDGYDAEAQTRCAQEYIRSRDGSSDPFFLVLSWGPPHNPYETAPERFRAMYDPDEIVLRPNVPEQSAAEAREWLAGYYAHCSALDEYVGDMLATLDERGIADDTIFMFTSDHGDMLGSQGEHRKQRPRDESVRVPCLLRGLEGAVGLAREVSVPFGAPDIMPTLLGLCGVPIPETVEGLDFSPHLAGREAPPTDAQLIACYHAFGEYWEGPNYRGIRTRRHTYVRDLNGPWLLYDNQADPYQQDNLLGKAEHAPLQAELDAKLNTLLAAQGDEFLPGPAYIERWGYKTDQRGTVPFTM
jgi:arylsulfatase A-like enzyme